MASYSLYCIVSTGCSYSDFLSYTRQKKNKTYILKPENGCQGKGIWLTKSPKEIKPQDHMLCQQYLSKVSWTMLNPLMGRLNRQSNRPLYSNTAIGLWWVGCYIWYSEEGPGRDSLSPSRSFLLWPQPWSLLTIMLLWHSFLIIIIIISHSSTFMSLTVLLVHCLQWTYRVKVLQFLPDP